jgi:hypothetical protein
VVRAISVDVDIGPVDYSVCGVSVRPSAKELLLATPVSKSEGEVSKGEVDHVGAQPM